jgi:hypothetical protein
MAQTAVDSILIELGTFLWSVVAITSHVFKRYG